MHRSLIARQVLPAVLLFLGLIGAALVFDALLHRAGLAWVGWWLGPAGTVLLLLSFLYSLRKRKLIARGSPKSLLQLHETLSWIGAMLILLHGGVHFHALIPWLALLAMLVVVASGLTGQVLLREAMEALKQKSGRVDDDIRVLDAATVDVMKRWRVVHLPLNAVFLALALVHILAVAALADW